MLHSCIKGFLRAKKLWVNPPKAERAKPSLSSDYNLLFKNKIGERSLDIHRVVSSSTDDFINTPLFSKGAGFYQTALEMVILGIAFIEIPRGNPRLQTREESRPSFLSSVKNIFRFSRSESFL